MTSRNAEQDIRKGLESACNVLRADNARLREALGILSAAVRPIREGKRDGATLGFLSEADDAARAALDGAE
jgi:hypothetical protein